MLLFLAFGSLTIPLKSIVLNLLSLSASLGVVTWTFQDGHLAGLLGFTPIGAIDVNFPVLVVAIAFGLAMDYQMFLIAQIKERFDRTGDHATSIAGGMQRTARIISSAALLLIIAVIGFSLAEISLMQMIGIGLLVAVVVDVLLVRGLLVPATMRLLGRATWWAPAPLARWWSRHRDLIDEPALEPDLPAFAETHA